jgi:deazaflavin-dependent oxidoreductase (nitroreductase family)
MDFTSWNAQVIEEFRANDGRVEQFGDAPLVILHSTGARTGTERENPLMYLQKGEDTVLFASRGGEDVNPDWYHNVVANPRVELEFGRRTVPGTAREATGAERDALYAEQAGLYPQFAEYERKTDRRIPVLVITPGA